MKIDMRFFLALLVATAYAANETCEDINGDGTVDDAYVCPAGYDSKVDQSGDIAQATTDDDTAAKTTACCDAKTGDFAGDANSSDVSTTTTLTFAAAATTVTCNAGYQVANANADGFQDTYTVALATDGTATTFDPATANAGCAVKTFQSATIAGSNYATAVTVTFGVTPTPFECATGFTIAQNDTPADATVSIAAVDATTGLPESAFTFSDGFTAANICVGNTFAAVTPGDLGLVQNSNYGATVSVTNGVALADFACDTDFELAKLADGTTAVTVTLGAVTASDGSFDISINDDNTTALTGATLCVAVPANASSATDPAAGSAAGSAGSAGSADESAASPAALAAAGMAAIALLL